MAAMTMKIAVYTNSDDAFVAWAPEDFVAECRGFQLERARKVGSKVEIDLVENRVGFESDKPKSGDRRPSNEWPFQRFNWTDHAVDVGHQVRYRVTAMIDSGNGRPYVPGPTSRWTPWATLTTDMGGGFSCYFNRGLVLSQFVARYLASKKITPAAFKAPLKKNVDPKFRAFLEGDLGLRLRGMLADAKKGGELHAALYELADEMLEDGLIAVGSRLHLILANGSDKSGDGNAASRQRLNTGGIATVDRLLKSRGLGHNKFVVLSDKRGPKAVWTGSTNWSTTGLCTQVNNGLLIEDRGIAKQFRTQWERLKDASPPALDPAAFPKALVSANDKPRTSTVNGARVTVWFTRSSDGRDMDALRDVISSAKDSILFLMFTPGKAGLHTLAGQRANEKDMYVRGVVSTLGQTKEDSEKSVLDISLVSSDTTFKPDPKHEKSRRIVDVLFNVGLVMLMLVGVFDLVLTSVDAAPAPAAHTKPATA